MSALSSTTSDGFTLAATIYEPGVARPPGVILLHRYGSNRAVWERTAHTLQQNGIMALALDLRGHGESRVRHGAETHFRQLPEDGWLDALEDVRVAKKLLIDHGAHPDNLAAVGEGMGASLALHYALSDPNIQAVVMLSPGLETQKITTEEAIKRLDDCPTLLMACEGDAYAAMSATTLNNVAPVYSEFRAWAGGAHGVDLFTAHPEAVGFMLEWLRKTLAAESFPGNTENL